MPEVPGMPPRRKGLAPREEPFKPGDHQLLAARGVGHGERRRCRQAITMADALPAWAHSHRSPPMQCPCCRSNDTTCVLNTVHRGDGNVRRRHGCRKCQIRWTGLESLEPQSIIAAFVPRPVVGDFSLSEADPTTVTDLDTAASAE